MNIKIYQCKTRVKFPLNIFGLLIMLFQRTKYTHYALGFTSITGQEVVFDSSMKSVRLRTYSKFVDEYQVHKIWAFDMDIKLADIYGYVESFLGTKYSTKNVFGLFFRLLGFKYFSGLKDGKKAVTCGELISWFFNDFGINADLKPDLIDLNDLEDILVANTKKYKWTFMNRLIRI